MSDTIIRLSKLKQQRGVLDDVKAFDIFNSLNNQFRDNPYYPQINDVLRGIFEYGKPKHLFSHLFINAFNTAVSSLDLILVNGSLVIGASTMTGGVELLRY